MDEMPDFEMLPPDPPSPRKPRRKPMKQRGRPKKAAALKPPKAVPVKRKKRRKVRVTKRISVKPEKSRVAIMFHACVEISSVLQPLSIDERKAVLESIGASL